MTETTGIRRYGPGKFDTVLDSYVFVVTLDGADDEAGSVTDNGVWFGMAENADGSLATAIAKATHDNGEPLTAEETELILRDFAGVIVSEDDQGFVSVGYYRTIEALRAAWDVVLAGVDEASETDEDGEEG